MNYQYIQQNHYVKNQDDIVKNKQISRMEYKIKTTSQYVLKMTMWWKWHCNSVGHEWFM